MARSFPKTRSIKTRLIACYRATDLLPGRRGFAALTLALALAAGPSARAQDAPPVMPFRTGDHASFERLVFDAPRGVSASVSRAGERVTLRFSRPVKVDLSAGADLTRAKSFTSKTEGDALVVSFSVAPGASVHDFKSGLSLVLDVTGPAAPAAQTAQEKPVPEKAAPKEPALPKPAPSAKADKKDKLAEPVRPEKTTPPPAPLPPTPAPPAPLPPTPAAPAVLEPAVPPSPVVAPAASGALAPAPQKAPQAPVSKAEALAPSFTLPAALREAPTIPLSDKPVEIASFDPGIELGTSIFQRAGIGTILFDRKVTLDLASMTRDGKMLIHPVPIELPSNSGFRFALPEGSELRATRIGTAWHLFLSTRHAEIPVSTSLIAQPDFALGARLLLPAVSPPSPVRLTDPVVGDELIVLPLKENGAFSSPRRMADFQLIPAAQGIVIKPLHEKVVVRSLPDAVEITAEGGLKLSPSRDSGNVQRESSGSVARPLFDLATWRGRLQDNFSATRQVLLQSLVEAPAADRVLARLELARFYFAHGFGEESLAILGLIQRELPDIETRPEFLALRGANRILVGQIASGIQDLSTPDLKGQAEVDLWIGAGEAERRNWAAAEEKFAHAYLLLARYPEPFFSRFSVLGIEAALAVQKLDEAKAWMDALEKHATNPQAQSAISYLKGVILSQEGQAEKARSYWREATRGADRLYKVRAELALVDLSVATGSLTPAQAAERLEGLRYAWRGDDLEIDILHRLAGFYADAKNVRMALNIMGNIVRLYPNNAETPAVRAEMSRIYRDVFLAGRTGGLSPIEALALYQDYRDLMPGDQQGVAITRLLAERLVSIDLLDQAGGLLDDLVRTRLTGEEKSRVGTRLAAIRLLDHKADASLTALDLSGPAQGQPPLPASLVQERTWLRARALSELHRPDEALALLAQDDSVGAKSLKADILMRSQKWSAASKALLDFVGEPPASGTALPADKTQALLSAALAQALDGDQAGLDKLAVDYGAAMNGTQQADLFKILTRPDKKTGARDLTAAQGRLAEVDLFKSFLNAYRKDDGAAPAAKP